MTHRSSRRLISLPLAVLVAAAIANPALAGTDGDDEFVPAEAPAFVQPLEAPPSMAPAPAVTAPSAVSVPTVLTQPERADTETAESNAATHEKAAQRQNGGHRAKAVLASTKAKAVVTPAGGVQAGAGGTAIESGGTPLGALIFGGLALLLFGGGVRAFARN